MTISRRHWLAAFLFAALAHGALVPMFWKPAQSGAASLGVGGMEISFGMAGGAPGANEVTAPETEPLEAREVETAEPRETAPETMPLETAEAVAVEPTPEPEPVEPVVPETVPVKEVTPRFEKLKPPKKPKPPKPVVEAPPKPAPPPPAPREAASEAPAPQQARAPALAGAAGKSGTQQTAHTGSGTSRSRGGLPGSSNSYFALLQAWLEKHKEHPSTARRRRSQGTAVLNFTLNRDGSVQRARIERSSGSPVLDREVLAMIKRATPLPAFPADFERDVITLSVPVQFRLR